jgi:putative hydrolase of the HAD superfamily
MKLPPAIFFDLDDTIIAFGAVAVPVWRELCENYERQTGKLHAQQLLEAIRKTSRWYWGDKDRHRNGRLNMQHARRQIVRQAFRELGNTNVLDAYTIADQYSIERTNRVDLFPGAKEALQALKNRGVRLALITNGEAAGQNAKIDRFHLRPYFEQIFVEGEVGFGKPDQRIYRLALDTLQITPQEVWMVGDNLEWEVGVPQQLGIYSVWNDWRGKGLPEDSEIVPDRIVNSIRELV